MDISSQRATMRRLGLVAQLVEQRIENPCVGGSIPPRATKDSAVKQNANPCRLAFLFSKTNHRLSQDISLVFLFPELPLNYHVVGAFSTVSPSELEDRRQGPIEHGAPQPSVGKKKHGSETGKCCGHIVASRQKMQHADCEQADDNRSTGRLRQQADNAQLALAYPGKPCKNTAEQQSCHEAAGAEIVGQYPNDEVAGVGHRAGQRCQHCQRDSNRQLWPLYGRSDQKTSNLRTPEMGIMG